MRLRVAGAGLVGFVACVAAWLFRPRPDDVRDDAPGVREMAPRTERVARTHADAAAGSSATVGERSSTTRRHDLTGTIRTFDGSALPGAVVHAAPVAAFPRAPDPRSPTTVTADATGAFDLRGLEAGDWALDVSAQGAVSVYAVTVRVPDRKTIDVALPRGSIVEGVVVDETTRAPVGDARVRLRNYPAWLGDTRTSREGRFRMTVFDGASDRHGYVVEAPGYATEPAESSGTTFDASVAGRHEVTLVASRGGTLDGRVVGPDGPVTGARVFLDVSGERDAAFGRRSTTADSAGRFVFERVSIDGHWVRAEAAGLVDAEAPDPRYAEAEDLLGTYVDTADGVWTVPDLVMVRPATRHRVSIAGRVLRGESVPVAGALVRTRQGPESISVVSGEDGSFVLAGVQVPEEDASVGIVATHDGDWPGESEWPPSAELGAEPVTIQVGAMPSVRGRVRRTDGTAVAGARVCLVTSRTEARCVFGGPSEPPPGVTTRTAEDGTFAAGLERDDQLAVSVEAPGLATWAKAFDKGEVPETFEITLREPHALEGRVVRAGTDAGVEGLDVSIVRDLSADLRAESEAAPFLARVVTTTGSDGTFHLDDLPDGSSVRASGRGWMDAEAFVDEIGAGPIVLVVQPAMELAGVLRFADGRPCPGVAVRATRVTGDADAAEETGAAIASADDGSFACGPLAPGSWRLDLTGGSPYVVHEVAGPFDAGTRDVRVVLVEGRTIRGRVSRPDGSPVKGAMVVAVAEGREAPKAGAQAGRDGSFEIRGLAEGAYAVSTDNEGFFRWTRSGVRAGGDPLDVRLDEGLAVAGVLRGPDGSAETFAWLAAKPVGDTVGEPRTAQADADGRFRIAALTPGRWRICLNQVRSSGTLEPVTVEAGSASLELTLTAPAPSADDR